MWVGIGRGCCVSVYVRGMRGGLRLVCRLLCAPGRDGDDAMEIKSVKGSVCVSVAFAFA